ncbi:MAG: STAS/SEC14 domain-containing protein [Bacteroidia bacterium]|nr:STAS/SEC14 domain-containing protein [Bacteroidia bacterium]
MEAKTKAIYAKFITEDIVEISGNPEWEGNITLENAQEFWPLFKEMVGDRIVGSLTFLSENYIDGDARDYLMTSEPVAKATAIVADSFMKSMIGNFLMKVRKSEIPTRIFSDPEEARAWIRECLAEYKSRNPGL